MRCIDRHGNCSILIKINTMKYTLIFICLFLTFTSCKKKKEDGGGSILDIPLRHTLKYDFTLPQIGAGTVEIPTPETAVPFTSPPITNTVPDEFKKNNLNINKVKSVVVEALNLNIKAPAGQTFSFLKSVKIYLGADGIGERLIASKDNINSISPAPTSLSMDPISNDIAPFIKGPTYYLKIEAVVVRTTTADIEIGSEIKILAIVNPL